MKIEDYFFTREEYEAYLSQVDQTDYFIAKKDKNGNFIKDENGHDVIEVKNYILTYDEYKESLWNTILGMSIDLEDALTSKNGNPTSFIVVSPPGAGKSNLASYEEAKFVKETSANLVRLDPDKIGIFHKHYKEIYENIPEHSFGELQKFIKPALNNTIRPFVYNSKLNTLTEGTFGDTKGYKEIIKNQKDKGYKVIISTIVTSNIERDLSSCERCQTLLENDLPVRIVNFDYSKNVESKFLTTMQQVEQEGLYDEIRVYRRGKDKNSAPILVYTSGDERYTSAVEAIRDEIYREERSIVNNFAKFQTRIDNLKRIIENDIAVEKSNFNSYTQVTNSSSLPQLLFRKEQLDNIQERFDEMLLKKEGAR